MRKRSRFVCFKPSRDSLVATARPTAMTAVLADHLFSGTRLACTPCCCVLWRARSQALVGQNAKPVAWCLIIPLCQEPLAGSPGRPKCAGRIPLLPAASHHRPLDLGRYWVGRGVLALPAGFEFLGGMVPRNSPAAVPMDQDALVGGADDARWGVLAPAARRRRAARAGPGAHAAEHAAVLHAAEIDVGGRGHRLARQLELVGLEPADLVADAGGVLELEVGRGVAHAPLELRD